MKSNENSQKTDLQTINLANLNQLKSADTITKSPEREITNGNNNISKTKPTENEAIGAKDKNIQAKTTLQASQSSPEIGKMNQLVPSSK